MNVESVVLDALLTAREEMFCNCVACVTETVVKALEAAGYPVRDEP